MRRTILCACAGAMLTTAAGAQQATTGERRMVTELAQAGGIARVAVETRVTRGKPYSGEAITEFVQVLGDGNRIVRKTAAKLYRDSDGRTRRETSSENGSPVEVNSVVITDPVAGTSLILDAGTKTVIKAPGLFAKTQGGSVMLPATVGVSIARTGGGDAAGQKQVEVTALPRERGAADVQAELALNERVSQAVTTFSSANGSVRMRSVVPGTKEDLGEQVVEGVMAKGTRTTTVIPAGAVGNEQPITTISEQWFSEELELLVLTKHSDPRVGETIYRLTNITRSEPDRTLFQAPPDYTVQERLTRPPVMFRQQQ